MVARGRMRSRPRHWTRGVHQTPGLRFLYWADMPDLCALVLDGVVITVLTREVCRPSRTYDRGTRPTRRPPRQIRDTRRCRDAEWEEAA